MILKTLLLWALITPCTALETLDKGWISYEPPRDTIVLYLNGDRPVVSILYEIGRFTTIGIVSYSWNGWGFLHSGPGDAERFRALTKEPLGEKFEVLGDAPGIPIDGLPTMELNTRYQMTRENGEKIWVRETYLTAQRKWGFVVLTYSNEEARFSANLHEFESLVRSVKLHPEPPVGLYLAGVLIAAALFISGLITYFRNRIKSRAHSS